MGSRSLRQSSFFPCTALSAWNLTCPTEAFLRFRSASSQKPVSNPLSYWRLRVLMRQTNPANACLTPRNHPRAGNPREVFADLHGAESADLAADDFRSLHCDSPGRRALLVGTYRLRGRGLQ